MGTRGFVGFVADGTEKIAYNHWYSYPSGLGVDVLAWLRGADITEVTEQVRALRVVDPDSVPTAEDIERLAHWADLGVGRQSPHDWYCLLRHTQGRPDLMLRAGVIEDASLFPTDSLFAEWGYVVDLDQSMFEVYKGFQKAAHGAGRFADRPQGNGYVPVALVASWPLYALPDDSTLCASDSDAGVS